ncbi:MAG: hypothetical protein ACKVK5_03800 [Pseudomonadales bacterium]|jgi:hypothetical protein
MPQPISELLLQRILAYWAWSGVVIDAATEEKALAITARALHQPEQQRLSFSLQALLEELPGQTPVAAASPPLSRSSMHYGDY